VRLKRMEIATYVIKVSVAKQVGMDQAERCDQEWTSVSGDENRRIQERMDGDRRG
jgi:hypothetical protein